MGRRIKQLDHIAVMLEELMNFGLIKEIGMPVEYSYKMKSLVLFITPKKLHESAIISKVFSTSSIQFPNTIVEVARPLPDQKLLNAKRKKKVPEKVKTKPEIVKAEPKRARCMPVLQTFLQGSWSIAFIVLFMALAIA